MASHSTFNQLKAAFFKYLFVGGIGFLVDFSVLVLCYRVFGVYYLIASLFGFIAGIITVYLACNKWVFNQRKIAHKPKLEFIIFLIIGIIGLALTQLFMWLFVELCHFPVEIAKCLTTGLVLVWNFGARKIILY